MNTDEISELADGKRDFGNWLKDLDEDAVADMRLGLKLLMIYEGGNDGSNQAFTSYLKEKIDMLGDEIELRKTRYFNEERVMNKRKRVFHVELPFFPGFHESELWNADSLLEVERELGRELGYGEFDHKGYEKTCCERFCEAFKDHAPECVEKVALTGLSSPVEYNFSTDRLVARVTLSPGWRNDVLGFMESEDRWLRGRIRNDFTSRDGYMSFLSSDMDDWIAEIKKDDPDGRYVSRVLGYMMFYGDNGIWNTLVMDVLEDVYVGDYVMGN